MTVVQKTPRGRPASNTERLHGIAVTRSMRDVLREAKGEGTYEELFRHLLKISKTKTKLKAVIS